MGDLETYRSRWGLHSIIKIDGEAYAVLKEWELWAFTSYKSGGGCTAMPSGEIDIVPLTDLVDDDKLEELRTEIL